MSIRNFDAFFNPRAVCLIGASRKPQSVGDVIARNLLTAGFEGPILPINPNATAIHSTIAYPDVASLPQTPDLAVICTPPDTVPALIDQLGRRGTRGAVVITAGFSEMGETGRKLQQDMLDASKPYTLRIIGPNCLGLLVPRSGLNASFAQRHALKGSIAFGAQSGAMITTVLDWAGSRGIGFSVLASLGGMADADFGDFLDYLATDTETRGILLYVEAVTNARKFMSAARRASRLKPVVVIKAGRHEEGAKAAASHTGALAGADAVYDAAFRRAGMLRVTTLEQLFDAVEILAANPPIHGDRLAIVTNGGGVGVLATDSLIDEGGRLAPLTPDTVSALDAVLPRTWSHGNPVDIIGDAPGSRYGAAMDAVLGDPNVDAVLVLNCPTAIADTADAAEAVIASQQKAVQKGRRLPLFTCWLGDSGAAKARKAFTAARVPTFETPDQAISGFMHLVRHAKAQEMLMETPEPPIAVESKGRDLARRIVEAAIAEKRSLLTEPESKALLSAYGIPIVETVTTKNVDEAVAAGKRLGYPLAVKILSPDITHKTDVGGVALDIGNEAALRDALKRMIATVRSKAPEARLTGFSVQRMASKPGAHELILGLAEDVLFGPVVLFGAGGTAVEVVRDKAIALLPLNATLAHELITRTRIHKLLEGYRGRPAADIDAIARVLLALGEIAADLPEVMELDINPLWADQSGVLALDARVSLNANAIGGVERFAIRPYPRDLERDITSRVGQRYRLRPIRPDDTPDIQTMISRCSSDDIRMRFFTALRQLPSKLAARLTQIDYDREMAFLALECDTPSPSIGGVVRLSCDPDFEAGEYAVLVRTDLKGTGLGRRLMAEIIDYAKSRGLKRIFGDVLRENTAMLQMARELGFVERAHPDDSTIVEVILELS